MANALTASRSVGAAASGPSMTSRAKPSSSRSRDQQRRHVAGPARCERDLPAQQVHPGALQLIQRPGLRGREQFQGLAERASLHVGLRRGEDPFGLASRIGGQQHRAFKERCSRS